MPITYIWVLEVIILQKLVFIFLITSSLNSLGQSIEFSLDIKNPCDGLIKPDSSFYLSRNFEIYSDTSSFYNRVVALPDTGTYMLYLYNRALDIDSIPITISDFKPTTYTYLANKIQRIKRGMHGPFVYECCNEPCQGFNQDRYQNGNLRIEGYFNEGKPIKDLNFYTESGQLKRKLVFQKRVTEIYEYDSESNLIKESFNSNKLYYLTDFTSNEYYQNGELKIRTRRKNGIEKIQVFKDNGDLLTKQTKNNRIEYDSLGNLKLKYHRSRRNVLIDIFKKEYKFTYKIRKEEYDPNGNLTSRAVYELWDYHSPNSIFSIDEADWIYEQSVFENGKLIS